MNLRDAVEQVLGVRPQPYSDEWPGACPSVDHNDRGNHASFNVEKGLFTCYSCGAGGRIDDLLRGVRISDPHPDGELLKVEENLETEMPARTYPESWLGLYLAGDRHPYWRSRFSDDAIDHFGLGYDYESGKVTYPLRSEDGAVLGVVQRALDDNGPKYKYPKGIKTHDLLFGWDSWPYPYSGPVVLVEGALDVVALWEAGVPALGIYGSRISDRQARLVRALNAPYTVCAFDQDTAGRAATERVARGLVGEAGPVYVASWDPSEAKDVADLSVPRRRQVIEHAEPW